MFKLMLPLAAVNQFESDPTLLCSRKDKAQPENEIYLAKLPAPVVTLYAVARSEIKGEGMVVRNEGWEGGCQSCH